MASPRSERIPLSPAEKAARLRRCARAIQQKVRIDDLISRGFTDYEIQKARTLIGGKDK